MCSFVVEEDGGRKVVKGNDSIRPKKCICELLADKYFNIIAYKKVAVAYHKALYCQLVFVTFYYQCVCIVKLAHFI